MEFKYPADVQLFDTLDDARMNGYTQLVEVIYEDVEHFTNDTVPDPHASYQGAPGILTPKSYPMRKARYLMCVSNNEAIQRAEERAEGAEEQMRAARRERDEAKASLDSLTKALNDQINGLQQERADLEKKVEHLNGAIDKTREQKREAEACRDHAEAEVAHLSRRVMQGAINGVHKGRPDVGKVDGGSEKSDEAACGTAS